MKIIAIGTASVLLSLLAVSCDDAGKSEERYDTATEEINDTGATNLTEGNITNPEAITDQRDPMGTDTSGVTRSDSGSIQQDNNYKNQDEPK